MFDNFDSSVFMSVVNVSTCDFVELNADEFIGVELNPPLPGQFTVKADMLVSVSDNRSVSAFRASKES